MKKILMMVLPFVLLTACVDSLDDWNIDQKRAPVGTAPAGTLFTNALKGLTDILITPSVNSNNYRMFVQYWATTTYLDEPRYNMTARTYSQNFWNAVYRDVLADLKEAKRLITADPVTYPAGPVTNNRLAIIEIMEVYAWSVLVNTFGDVPYRQALDIENLLPEYDDDETVIYPDIISRLDKALGMLTPSANSFGTADVFYSGSVPKWIKFGNSLKLKIGMLLADSKIEVARTMVEQAASNLANLIQSNEENAGFPYITSSGNNNPVSANTVSPYTTREDFVVTSTIVDVMNDLDDPRREQYFTKVGANFVGGKYGFSNEYADFSHPGPAITDPEAEGILMEYAEVEFLLAEAVERGFNVPGTAEEHYENAIKASIAFWNPEADADAYLSQPEVAYATAATDWKEKIGTQRWIALFNRGWESWVQWRRLDQPVLLPPAGDGINTALKIPVRMIFPVSEQTLNGTQWETAAGKMTGGDSPDAKLFWDIF
ncbi:SusD/RagB family nutrient-binding outer membrane lipoprotein [Chryseosolibacter indicus]|uniref:SusD/RagB family nutrient-binding outer membrane lipoprotein n=1 Tax=Chryseosolibacter indicus TaxID=2782351 RepID=A0ABS5VNU5_9BACT|nr:SusD/RagB family nutrient-binding outer membrane lipoprotein [Chryseosolibacter indicus]MBT1703125.1 SusD/RagB family nutrient-binding outer membrane lipoprotein [Chryseosolibacter indicus]